MLIAATLLIPLEWDLIQTYQNNYTSTQAYLLRSTGVSENYEQGGLAFLRSGTGISEVRDEYSVLMGCACLGQGFDPID